MPHGQLVFLVHGYSINRTGTYGQLHRQLERRGFAPREIQLGRYVSLDDDIELRDLARAMDRAVRAALGPLPSGTPFHMLTHSTGALVARHWLLEHYSQRRNPRSRLGNLVFLAGPHFGSRLAHHGRSVIARVWRQGDVGQRVLSALELGSQYGWESSLRLAAEPDFFGSRGIRPYCLSGDRTSRDLLRHVGLLREKGSDEVVRLASANLNFRHYKLDMLRDECFDHTAPAAQLSGIPFAALRSYTHSGAGNSILQSISAVEPPNWSIKADSQDDRRLNLKLIVHLLASPTDNASYAANRELLASLTDSESQRLSDCAQLQLRFLDRDGRPVEDYFVEFGEARRMTERDRYGLEFQRMEITQSKAITHIHCNSRNPHILTLFIDRSLLAREASYGMRVFVEGQRLLHWEPQASEADSAVAIKGDHLLDHLLPRHSTTLVDVTLDRVPARALFQFDSAASVHDDVALEAFIEQELLAFSRSRAYRALDDAARRRALSRLERQLDARRPELRERFRHDYHVLWDRSGRIRRSALDG
ncbi:hypothetical protein KDL29_13145 [bacterium]|nr:hypothetical protein [bacterium]